MEARQDQTSPGDRGRDKKEVRKNQDVEPEVDLSAALLVSPSSLALSAHPTIVEWRNLIEGLPPVSGKADVVWRVMNWALGGIESRARASILAEHVPMGPRSERRLEAAHEAARLAVTINRGVGEIFDALFEKSSNFKLHVQALRQFQAKFNEFQPKLEQLESEQAKAATALQEQISNLLKQHNSVFGNIPFEILNRSGTLVNTISGEAVKAQLDRRNYLTDQVVKAIASGKEWREVMGDVLRYHDAAIVAGAPRTNSDVAKQLNLETRQGGLPEVSEKQKDAALSKFIHHERLALNLLLYRVTGSHVSDKEDVFLRAFGKPVIPGDGITHLPRVSAPFVIGRSSECDVVLGSSQASRVHASVLPLYPESDGAYVVNRAASEYSVKSYSDNWTLVNGVPLDKGKIVVVKSGALITLPGGVTLGLHKAL